MMKNSFANPVAFKIHIRGRPSDEKESSQSCHARQESNGPLGNEVPEPQRCVGDKGVVSTITLGMRKVSYQ